MVTESWAIFPCKDIWVLKHSSEAAVSGDSRVALNKFEQLYFRKRTCLFCMFCICVIFSFFSCSVLPAARCILVNFTYQRSHLRQPSIVMCKWRSLRSGGLQRRVRGTYGILDMQLRTSSSKGSKQNEERKAEERNGRPALVLIIMQ